MRHHAVLLVALGALAAVSRAEEGASRSLRPTATWGETEPALIASGVSPHMILVAPGGRSVLLVGRDSFDIMDLESGTVASTNARLAAVAPGGLRALSVYEERWSSTLSLFLNPGTNPKLRV